MKFLGLERVLRDICLSTILFRIFGKLDKSEDLIQKCYLRFQREQSELQNRNYEDTSGADRWYNTTFGRYMQQIATAQMFFTICFQKSTIST